LTADVPHVDPLGVYTPAAAARLLGFRTNTLPRYMRKGQLRYAKRGGRVLILGSWLMEFLAGGEVLARPRIREAAA